MPAGDCSCRSNDNCSPGATRNCDSGEPQNQTPIGWHDGSSGTQTALNCVAAGWATDPDDKNIDLKVKVLVDGNQFGGENNASLYRNDLSNSCPGGTCHFFIPLTGLTGSHAIKVQGKGCSSKFLARSSRNTKDD